ncbi:endo-1,4-beta-xylanase xylA, putative (macronuclear) [Tetrahymena thermophila SB210]|uniref:Endo-1,4-beta-xylanase xylA, putative n=1 Tax=Tetrahymena thermophila (strain SB210) TaxID=312017 RepID=I7MJE8_TETTS|nr:endo-1,4-beta-xylanase xylA, putative [Tetrahymena thermophila SB210]EAR96272.1 endo-1,4-beta-xylanase xylA, putative [Tetrahymena thermophila SB210]|eukprot:XP_001016517.1 endo-1,4-beta-xylanase xylA, putative [Tetrahymena thermophila SB210]
MNQKLQTELASSSVPLHQDQIQQKSQVTSQFIRKKRKLQSAQQFKSQSKINFEQVNNISSSSKKLLSSKESKESILNFQQGYFERAETPSEGLFEDNKLVQQVFVRSSLTLNNSSNLSPVKQQICQKSTNENSFMNIQQQIEPIQIKINKQNSKGSSFSTLDGKKATEIVNQSIQNSLKVEIKIQNIKGDDDDNNNNQSLSNKPKNVIEIYKMSNSKEKGQQQNNYVQDDIQQFQTIQKIKNQGFNVISNLLDQQKSNARSNRYSYSQDLSGQVQGRSNQNSLECKNFKLADNSQKIIGEDNLKQSKHTLKEEEQQQQINIQYNSQRRDISNNYREYLKNKLQYSYPPQIQQQMEYQEEDHQRILKGGIIVGKQVQRTRKNTSYGKGISVFENLLQRKQLQINQSQNAQEQKKLVNKQNQVNFTQSFYQNLIKQSKRLNNLINQQEQDWNRKQKYINLHTKSNQESLTSTKQYNNLEANLQQQLSSSKEKFQTNAYPQSQQLCQNYSFKNDQECKENINCSLVNVEQDILGETHRSTQDVNEIFNNQLIINQAQQSSTLEIQSQKAKMQNIERPYSQSLNRSKKQKNAFDENNQISYEQQYLYNFKKKQNLYINPESNQSQQEINDSVNSVSSSFTDKVIKHFRFSNTMKNSEVKNLTSLQQQNNVQQDCQVNNFLVIQDQKDAESSNDQIIEHKIVNENSFLKKDSKQSLNKCSFTSKTSNLFDKNNFKKYKLQNNESSNNNSFQRIPNKKIISQRGSLSIPYSNRTGETLPHQFYHIQNIQDKRRSLCIESQRIINTSKNNKSSYSISPDKKIQLTSNKKIQNYVSELVNKYSHQYKMDEECGPWADDDEDDINDVAAVS